jgi:chromosome segregation ATPase
MDGLSWGAVVAVVAFCCSLCSVASFLLGRRKVAQDEGKEEGTLATDLRYIKETIKDTTKSLDALNVKLDAQNKQREEDYRDLLVQITELKASYKSLHIRVDNISRRVDEYHHP